MNQIYQPSGKVSALSVPVYAVMLAMAAISALACACCVQLSPYSVLDAAICFAVAKGVGKYGALWCIRLGKVRNSLAATVGGMFAALWYGYFLVACYLPMQEMFRAESIDALKDAPEQMLGKLSFSDALHALLELKRRGADITGKGGDVYFSLPGTVSIALLAVCAIIMVAYFAWAFREASKYPYFEDSGRWAREFVMVRSMPEDEELFRSKLLLGETGVLAGLRSLEEVNVDHYKVSLFFGDDRDGYYVSLSRMAGSGEVDRRTGKMVFEEEEMIKYLAVGRDVGSTLLTRRPVEEEDAVVRVVTDEAMRKAKRWLIFDWAVSLLLILFGVFAIFKIDRVDLPRFMMKGGFFYFAAMFLGNAVRLVRCFQGEMVIESTEARLAYDGRKRYLGTETEAPILYKLFYFFLMVSAAVLFGVCIGRME